MKTSTLKALKSSIAHWERMASGKRERNEMMGVNHCALCKKFWGFLSCKSECPIAAKTGKSHCRGTPYAECCNKSYIGYDSDQFKSAARKELAFLKSLLPKGKK